MGALIGLFGLGAVHKPLELGFVDTELFAYLIGLQTARFNSPLRGVLKIETTGTKT
jgi:hypothetical protein